MAVNKVTMNTSNGEETLIDLTGDSVTPETLAEGVTAHDASGEQITGTMVASSMTAENLSLTLEDGSTVAFAAVQSLAIPEGNVVKIEDASGNVLWEAQSNEVTITIAGTGNASYCYVSINGVKYTSAATLTVERGTVITCYTGSKECDCGKEGGGNFLDSTVFTQTKITSWKYCNTAVPMIIRSQET